MSASAPIVTRPKYRSNMDGLRTVAILSIVIFHAFFSAIKDGFIDVYIFLVISGFLISSIIFEKLRRGTFGFGE